MTRMVKDYPQAFSFGCTVQQDRYGEYGGPASGAREVSAPPAGRSTLVIAVGGAGGAAADAGNELKILRTVIS